MAKDALNPKTVSLATGATAGVLSLLCAVLLSLFPYGMMSFFGSMFHRIDIMAISRSQMMLGSSLLGVVAAIAVGLVAGWVFAVVYNYVARRAR